MREGLARKLHITLRQILKQRFVMRYIPRALHPQILPPLLIIDVHFFRGLGHKELHACDNHTGKDEFHMLADPVLS